MQRTRRRSRRTHSPSARARQRQGTGSGRRRGRVAASDFLGCQGYWIERFQSGSTPLLHKGCRPGTCSRDPMALARGAALQRRKPQRDRQSVVEGKSVSVSVDLGGRRYNKKKKNK